MTKKVIQTEKAAQPIGCYSQAIQVGNFVFISGQIGISPNTGALVAGGIDAELDQVFSNLTNITKAVPASLDDVVKLSVYLKNLSDFPKVNERMQKVFQPPYPARVVIQAAALPKEALVEMDAILHIK